MTLSENNGRVGVGVCTQIMISILVWMYSVVFLDDIVEISVEGRFHSNTDANDVISGMPC